MYGIYGISLHYMIFRQKGTEDYGAVNEWWYNTYMDTKKLSGTEREKGDEPATSRSKSLRLLVFWFRGARHLSVDCDPHRRCSQHSHRYEILIACYTRPTSSYCLAPA